MGRRGHGVPVGHQFAVFGALHEPVFVPVGEALDLAPGAALGQLLAGIVELVAADEINDLVFAQRLFRQHGDVRADEADFDVRVLRFESGGRTPHRWQETAYWCA